MRILFYYYMGGGGGGTNISLLLQVYARTFPRDHIDVVCHSSSILAKIPQSNNLSVHVLKNEIPKELKRLKLGLWEIYAIAQGFNSDVIWSMNLGLYKSCSIPQVISINNLYQVYPWSEIVSYHPSGWISLAVLRWFSRRSLRASTAIIVQTKRMKELIQKDIFLKRSIPIFVIGKPLESELEVKPKPLPEALAYAFEKDEKNLPFMFLYVSTASPHKNHFILIDAFKKLKKMNIQARLIFTISAQEVQFIDKEAQDLIDERMIVPVGWVDKQHLRALYDACDACLMPSVLESLSSAHLEAMGWGKPQIIADLPYARDLCGNAALYADPNSGEDWARKIFTLMGDEELRKKLVIAGMERVKSFPVNWSDAAEKVRNVLLKVTGIIEQTKI